MKWIDRLLGRTADRAEKQRKLDAAILEMETYLEERRADSERPTKPNNGLRNKIDSAAELALDGLRDLGDGKSRGHAR